MLSLCKLDKLHNSNLPRFKEEEENPWDIKLKDLELCRLKETVFILYHQHHSCYHGTNRAEQINQHAVYPYPLTSNESFLSWIQFPICIPQVCEIRIMKMLDISNGLCPILSSVTFVSRTLLFLILMEEKHEQHKVLITSLSLTTTVYEKYHGKYLHIPPKWTPILPTCTHTHTHVHAYTLVCACACMACSSFTQFYTHTYCSEFM